MSQDYNQAVRVHDEATLLHTLRTVEAGDTVKATFYDPAYKTFDIVGVIQIPPYDANQLVLASWFLNTPSKLSNERDVSPDLRGKPSKVLKALEIIETTERALF
jgi:hypothetical protein